MLDFFRFATTSMKVSITIVLAESKLKTIHSLMIKDVKLQESELLDFT